MSGHNKIKIRRGDGAPIADDFGDSNIVIDQQNHKLYGLNDDGTTVMLLSGLSSTEVDGKIDDLNLGTAATKNTGTNSGQVPILGTGGKLDENVLPALALTEVFVVADIAARDALVIGSGDGEVQTGDVVVVTDASDDPEVAGGSASYIYNGTGWTRLKSPAKAHSELLAIMGSSEGYHLSQSEHGTLTGGANSNADSLHTHRLRDLQTVGITGQPDDSEVLIFDNTAGGVWVNRKVGFLDLTGVAAVGQIPDLPASKIQGLPGDLGDIADHIADKSNPHSVTQSQVGLGNVENYGIATKGEAEAGTLSNKYMTPQRTKQAIDALAPGTELSINQSGGLFIISSTGDPGGVEIPAAGVLDSGVVNTTTQSFAGKKTFYAHDEGAPAGLSIEGSQITNAVIDCGTY